MSSKLYLVHCGFYDSEVCGGVYESHVNLFVVATDFEEARLKAKQLPEFKLKRMHIDGLQELTAVSGFRLSLTEEKSLEGKTVTPTQNFRELAPKPANIPTASPVN